MIIKILGLTAAARGTFVKSLPRPRKLVAGAHKYVVIGVLTSLSVKKKKKRVLSETADKRTRIYKMKKYIYT